MASFGDHCDPKLLLIDRTGSGFDMETFKDREALFLALLEGTGLMREPELVARLGQLEAAADAIRTELGEAGPHNHYGVTSPEGYANRDVLWMVLKHEASESSWWGCVAAAIRRRWPDDPQAYNRFKQAMRKVSGTAAASDRWPCGELKDGGPEDVMGCPIHGEACPDADDDNDESEDDDG